MKLLQDFCLLCLCFLSYSLYAASDSTGYIKVSRWDCRDKKSAVYRSDSLYVYQMPDSLPVGKYLASFLSNPLLIGPLPAGQYRLRYDNIDGTELTKEVNITSRDTQAVTLCLDSFGVYHSSEIEKLQEGDRITLHYFTQGCFHSVGETIMITRKGPDWVAELYRSRGWFDRNSGGTMDLHDSPGIKKKKVKLNEAQLKAYVRFESELQQIQERGGCTTTDWYELNSPYLRISKTDGTCSWNGYAYLREALFGKMKW